MDVFDKESAASVVLVREPEWVDVEKPGKTIRLSKEAALNFLERDDTPRTGIVVLYSMSMWLQNAAKSDAPQLGEKLLSLGYERISLQQVDNCGPGRFVLWESWPENSPR